MTDIATPLLSLAAGVLPEFAPDVIVAAAAEAGYRATGIWCDTDSWTATTTRQVAQRLREGALTALDIEVIWIRAGRTASASARRLIEIGGELGARNVLIVSANPDMLETQLQFAELCELAAAANMRAVLEFLMIAQVRTLAQASAIVQAVDHPAGGVLIDALHLARCGATPADVAALPWHWLPYAQLCDGPAELNDRSDQGFLTDAIDGRSAPGEGGLPLADLLAALPQALPLSLEVRSRYYREQYPEAAPRARAVLSATERFFANLRPAER